MDINNIFLKLQQLNIVNITIKALGILFSIGYLIYALVHHQQLVKMDRNYQSPENKILFSLSFLQLFIAGVLVVYSLLLL